MDELENIEEVGEADEELDDCEVVTLTADNGEETEFAILDVVDCKGEQYVIALPTEEEEEGGVVIFHVEPTDDDNCDLVAIDDKPTLDAVFEVFKQRNKDKYNFE